VQRDDGGIFAGDAEHVGGAVLVVVFEEEGFVGLDHFANAVELE
jgi:hypothetical protein